MSKSVGLPAPNKVEYRNVVPVALKRMRNGDETHPVHDV
jgi:hypothetical protein